MTLAPTFVPFTPWTTIGGYVDLLAQLDALELVEGVAPIQLAIRLLVTAESKLLELPDIRASPRPVRRRVAHVPVASSRSARGRSAARRHADRWRSVSRLARRHIRSPPRARHRLRGPPRACERCDAAIYDRGVVLLAEPGPEQLDLV